MKDRDSTEGPCLLQYCQSKPKKNTVLAGTCNLNGASDDKKVHDQFCFICHRGKLTRTWPFSRLSLYCAGTSSTCCLYLLQRLLPSNTNQSLNFLRFSEYILNLQNVLAMGMFISRYQLSKWDQSVLHYKYTIVLWRSEDSDAKTSDKEIFSVEC